MKGGAVDFLPKPFSRKNLVDAVNKAIDEDRRIRVERVERAAARALPDAHTV
jgi:FixJ family two-component response regulator